jgi:hypothetical protein
MAAIDPSSKIAAGGKLGERGVDVLNSRWCAQPSGFAQNFVKV